MPSNLLDDAELETESKELTWTLNFGPQHPATHTTLRLLLELDGERIVKATPDIGYLHSGFEKLGEHLNFNQYVTIAELSRISDHLLCTGAAALDLGGFTAFLYAFNQRELIYDVYEEMSGYRFHPGYTRVGGVLYDFNDRVLDRICKVQQSLPAALRDVEKLLFRNKIFLDRTRGIGVLT